MSMFMYRGPPQSPFTPPSWQTLPGLLQIFQGASFGLAQYINNPSAIPITGFALNTGTLPTGVTLNTSSGVISAASNATVSTANGLSFNATY